MIHTFFRVTKEVDINSKEAKQELKKQEESKKKPESSSGPSIPGYEIHFAVHATFT